jgi:hypothetical protein
VIDKISTVITRWNVLRTYNKNDSNCQAFVEELLDSLGVDLKKIYKGATGNYLKKMRSKGECKLRYKIPKEIYEKLKLKKNEEKITFLTHKELDDFVIKLIEVEPKFQEDYVDDYNLLKSFDRAFWLRHFKLPEENNFLYSTDKFDKCICPFDDPTQTRFFLYITYQDLYLKVHGFKFYVNFY